MPTPKSITPKPKGQKPSAAEWGQWRSWMAKQGIPQAVIDQVFGLSKDTFTREQAAQNIATWAGGL
jgi:hypothetical protein